MASIKHYPRESIVDWQFGMVGDSYGLTYVRLSETITKIDPMSFKRTSVKNQLVLKIDEEGYYYQQTITKKEGDDDQVSAPMYPENNSGKMRFIPFEFVVDQKGNPNKLPLALGILHPICLKAISRYQVNADLKEALHKSAQPTSWSSGWTESNYETYKKLTGRSHVGGRLE